MGSAHVAGFRKETHLGSTDAHAEPSGSRANDVGVLHRHNLHRRRTSFASGVRRLLRFFLHFLEAQHGLSLHPTYSAGTSMWAWLVGKMYFSLVFSQIMVAFGLPTLGFNTMKYRVFIIPLVLFTVLEWSRVNTILNDAFRVPVHAAGTALERRSGKHEEDSDDAYFASGSTSDVPALEEDARQEIFVSTTRIGNSRKRKVMRGIVPVEEMKKSTRRQKNILENTREQGKAEIEYKVKKGIWQTYAPSVLWPLAAEKSAGSIFLRCWKQIKARKQTEAAAIASVSHLPDSDQQKRDVIKDIELKKQVREKAADAVLRKSTSPYLAEIRRKRQEEEAAVVDTTKPPPSQRVSQEKRSSSSDQG